MSAKTRATVEDLYQVPGNGKAEIVSGELVLMSPTGFWPSRASGAIYLSLYEHERKTRSGYAIPDNVGFIVDLPNRGSFSPGAAWFTGRPTGMRFLEEAPTFAVEVRSEGDYGASAEQWMAARRGDYFAAGTLCVWDVDVLSPDLVTGNPQRQKDLELLSRLRSTSRDDRANAILELIYSIRCNMFHGH
jgi:Uma2 family endonuclease